MIPFPKIDPAIFRFGKFEIRWYGLMYVFGFLTVFSLVKHQVKKFNLKHFEPHLDNLNLVMIISLILGARLGYVLFCNFSYYINHPLEILATWQGGMSFHGGMLGVILGGYIFCKIKKLHLLEAADLYATPAPLALMFGRIGNFINGELYGRVTNAPWGMIFPDGGPQPRHPSQIYEALLEGVVLFLILWTLKNKRWPHGSLLGAFLFFYGLFRIIAEFFREPDAHIGFLFGAVTMGQILSIFMIIGGLAFFIFLRSKNSLSSSV